MDSQQLVALAHSVLAGDQAPVQSIFTMKKFASQHFGLDFRKRERKTELASGILAAYTGDTDQAQASVCIKIELLLENLPPHHFDWVVEGLVHGHCSAASFVEQVGVSIFRNAPGGPASLGLGLAIGIAVLVKQGERYICHERIHGEVELSEGFVLIIKEVGVVDLTPLWRGVDSGSDTLRSGSSTGSW